MKNNFARIVFTCIVLFAVSCSRTVSDLSLYVPKDASAVFIIDPKSISDKIASSGITIDSLANLFSSDKSENALQWNDIKNSGIDLEKQIYVFTKATNSMQQGMVATSALIAEVNDAKKLEAFLKKERAGHDVLDGKDYKYYQLGNDFIAGWTDKILIISNVTGGNAAPGKYNTGEGTLSQQLLTTLFAQKESESIASVAEFHEAVSKKGDIHFYTNTSSSLASASAAPIPGMSKITTLMEGSYSSGIVDFEKGKAIASTEFHAGKELAAITSKYPSTEIKLDVLKSYPDTLSGFGIISFNPKILLDILHYLGFDMMVDGFASNLGFTSADVVNALSGDIAFMASPASAENAAPQTQTTKHGNFIVSFTIGDKAAFDKVMGGLINKKLLTKNGDYYQLGEAGGHGFVIAAINDKLLIASDENITEAYKASTKKIALPQDVEKEISNKSMAMYFDINSMLNDKSSEQSNFTLRGKHFDFANGMQAAKATFKNFIATSDKGDGKVYKGEFELNFMNDNENSLASLAKFVTFLKKQDMQSDNDSSDNATDSSANNQ